MEIAERAIGKVARSLKEKKENYLFQKVGREYVRCFDSNEPLYKGNKLYMKILQEALCV